MKTSIQLTSLLLAWALFVGCSPESSTLSTVKPIPQTTPPTFDSVKPLPQDPSPEFAKVEPLPQDPAPEFPKAPTLEKPEAPTFEKVTEQKSQWITEDGGQGQMDFNPQVDILFVIDNSDSMKSAQSNLAENIGRFTEKIAQNRMIDFHVGVISTWDSSERFATTKKDPYGLGELRHVKDSKGQKYNARFITRKEQSLMASTLKIGVAAYADGGPENEEFFSPLMAALEKSGRGGPNEGFFRPDAQLVVVLMTDADDSNSNMSHEQVVSKLVEFKEDRKEKVSVYGVLVKASDADQYKDWALKVHPKYNPQCFDSTGKGAKLNGTCAKGLGPERLEQFILAANTEAAATTDVRSKYIMSIVSKTFGSDLAKIGQDIKKKTLAKEIFLSQVPIVEDHKLQLRIRYGTAEEISAGKGRVIPQGSQGWLYSPENNSVRLSGDIEYSNSNQAGLRFAVDLKPVILK